jgi:hypothetical protein
MWCVPVDIAFTGKNTKVFARLNRAELGDFDALVLGLFLTSQFKGFKKSSGHQNPSQIHHQLPLRHHRRRGLVLT